METDVYDDTTTQALPVQSKPSFSPSSRRVILLEDLPNISHPPTRSSFNMALDAFLHQSGNQNIPLILIVSENIPRLDEWGAEGSGNNYKDRIDATLTVRSLIPASTRRNLGFGHIE